MNSTDLTVDLYRSIGEQDHPREIRSWHASSLAQCPRAQYLARLGTPRTNSPTGAKILRWSAGHLIEATIRPHLQSLMPELISNKRYASRQLDLTGEIDNFDPASKHLVEVKSVSGHAVRYRKVGEDRYNLRDNQQYLHHEWQQHAYVLLMAEDHAKVEGIVYLYITLDGLLVPYVTEVKPEIIEHVKNRLAVLNHAWATEEPPSCLCGETEHPFYKPVMQYCDYKTEDGCCDLPG